MYKKILIPTDGSDIAQSAAHAGLAFAKDMNAEVVSIFVIPEYQYPLNIEMVPTNFPSAEDYRASMRKLGEIYMDQLRSKACDVGVVFFITNVSANHGADDDESTGSSFR